MFNIINDKISVKQHHRVEVEYLEAGASVTYDSPYGTDFILSDNSSITSNKFSVSGTFCAASKSAYSIDVASNAVVIHTYGVSAMDTVAFSEAGEPGSLSYIDGCSNTNVISPLRNGDPCANYLYFPPKTTQSLHTHPSVRIGLVLSGRGIAVSPHDKTDRVELVPGMAFLLDRYTLHAFNTEDSHMSLFAFHPDSEDGPTDEGNPMRARTYLK